MPFKYAAAFMCSYDCVIDYVYMLRFYKFIAAMHMRITLINRPLNLNTLLVTER